jgi:kynureninase
MEIRIGVDFARELDQQDELAHYRQQFVIDDPDLIYLDGNSLGRLPRVTEERINEVIRPEWGSRLIRSWNDSWYEMPERIGSKLAKLVGAQSDEVIIADSTSVNLFKLVMAALHAQPGRRKIVTDDLNFPSDLYILQGAIGLAGPDFRLEVVPSNDGLYGPVDALAGAIDDDTALVTLSHTVFKSSYTYDMAQITELAHDAEAMILWDTSHSAGAMPVDFGTANVDLAIGCTYKYLNGGPGAPAFIYVRRDLQDKLRNSVSGWMSQNKPFDFDLNYVPVRGMRRFLSGTPPLLSLAAVEPGLDILIEAGLDRIRDKSIRQTEYLIGLWEEVLQRAGYWLKSPIESEVRGSHVTLGHKEGWRVNRALIEEMNVLPDFRQPDNIRLGIAPLYTSFEEIHTAVERLQRVVDERMFENYSSATLIVT